MKESVLAPVRTLIRETALARSDAVLLAAVSGGADSVALLLALWILRAELGYQLCAVHVQHGLRGESSLADERFVRELCARLDVPLIVRNAGLTGSMDDPGVETRARLRRRELFAEAMHAFHADALLLAHHQGDQAETVLMHLLRGAGTDGLSGMKVSAPFEGGVILRPFLFLPKQALLDALRELSLAHREDESNQKPCTPRNALRLEVMPGLERLFPGTERHIAMAADSLSADARCLNALADRLYQSALYDYASVFALRASPLREADGALSRRALRRWVTEGVARLGLSPEERAPSHEETLALLRLLYADRGGCLNLCHDLKATVGAHCLHLTRQDGLPLSGPPEAAPIPLEKNRDGYSLLGITLTQSPAAQTPRDAYSVLLSPALWSRCPTLRAARLNDTIQPFGMTGSKPLRRFMTDCKLDAPFRRALPVLAAGSEILWIPALAASEALRVQGDTDDCLCLRCVGEIPYLP